MYELYKYDKCEELNDIEIEDTLDLKKYRFSVSMCVYGGDDAEHFDLALQSIFNQTLLPDEIVLVVDGPVGDDINGVIEKYEVESGILKVIRLLENEGHGNGRRKGLENCTYELVAIMDADDIAFSDRFEKQISAFKSDDSIDVVGGNITEFVGEPDNIVGKRCVPQKDAEIKEYLKTRCPMNLVTVMFKKSSVSEVGGFIDWYCEEDYYLWARMLMANKKFKNLEDILVNVRVGKDMYRRRGGIKYFKSEASFQKYLYKNKIITLPTFYLNVVKRLIVQVLMPNSIRGFIFKKIARES